MPIPSRIKITDLPQKLDITDDELTTIRGPYFEVHTRNPIAIDLTKEALDPRLIPGRIPGPWPDPVEGSLCLGGSCDSGGCGTAGVRG
jgi:hypothetical protein